MKLKDKALDQIEQLCYIWENSPKTPEDAQKIIDQIYEFAHCVQKRHSCYHVHINWREELENSKLDI